MGGGDHRNEVIETDCSIRLLRLESDGAQRPSNLPSRKAYRDDYYALIINGKKNPSVPLDMGSHPENAGPDQPVAKMELSTPY